MKYSIQHKILLSFAVVTFIGLASLLLVTYKIIENNFYKSIDKDMLETSKNLDIYLKQFFLINNMKINNVSLESEGDDISRELTGQMGSNVVIYNSRGDNLSSSLTIKSTSDDDFSNALKGKTSYSINYIDDNVIVNFSSPIESNNKDIIGIIRYSKDYSELYNENRNFEYIINTFAVVIFLIILITSFIISRQIARPVRILTKSTDQIYTGDFNIHINIRSKDEIGELIEKFKKMALRIKEQIEIIEKDRNDLKEAQTQSKTFFDNVTHELKTPMTTILGYAQILKDNGFSDKNFFDKGMAYIIDESKRMNNMVIEILELSKAASKNFNYHFTQVDLSKMIRKTCDEMGMKGRRYNISISCDVQDNMVFNGDEDKLKEVLINLVDNSIKYGKVNSTIEVECYRKERFIFLKVKDIGEGIPEEHLDHIFDPFYRVSKKDSREKGSAGLGLAIVKSIVENHGGNIYIESKMNVGTQVVIRFGGGEDI